MSITFIETAPISPLFNCTHMPQGISINHLKTPRRIPQAALQKVQLPEAKQVNYSLSDLFLTCLERLSKSVKQFGSGSGPTTCQTSYQFFPKLISRQHTQVHS